MTLQEFADWLQAEHKVWVDREYPGQPPDVPLAGMVEEAGELVHCVLKMEQEERWGPDPRYPNLRADLVDAIGDCAIYCASLCNAVNTPLSFRAITDRSALTLRQLATTLVLVAARGVNEPSYRVTMLSYVDVLQGVAAKVGVDFVEAVQSTWARVQKRTRTRPPKPRVAVLCGSGEAHRVAASELALRGYVVLHDSEYMGLMDGVNRALFELLHQRKVDMADEVHVLNVGGAVSESTVRAVAYAKAQGKTVLYLEAP